MYHKRQLAACYLNAVCFTGALSAGRVSWWYSALISLGVGLAVISVWRFAPEEGIAYSAAPARKPLLFLSACFTAFMSGWSAALSGLAFPMLRESPLIPLVIFVLSVYSIARNESIAARVSAVTMPFLTAFLLLIICFGAKEVDLADLTQFQIKGKETTILLLPLCAAVVPTGKGKTKLFRWILCGAIVTGLTGIVAASAGSLYKAAMSVSVFGVMERFESLLSALLCFGAYSMCSILGIAAVTQMYSGKERKKAKDAIMLASGIAGLGAFGRVSDLLLVVLCSIFWVAFPAAILVIVKRKKCRKSG